MLSIKVKELTNDMFKPYGRFNNLINPKTNQLGPAPAEWYPDIQNVRLRDNIVSFSICKVLPRPYVVTHTEYHECTEEGILPLDGDILIHVGLPDNPGNCASERFEVFRVPQGTIVSLKPGVWHYSPFTVTDKPVNILIVLPERTYSRDCVVVLLDEGKQLKIEQ